MPLPKSIKKKKIIDTISPSKYKSFHKFIVKSEKFFN